MLIKTVLPIVLFFGSFEVDAKETVFVINGKKLTNVVSTRFLSYSTDLDGLFEGVNNGASNVFVENLYPAFVRVVEFNNSFPLQKWIFLQKWFKRSRLEPIFTITSKFSKPNHLLPFLKVNEEMGFHCYWQLHYDCDNSPAEYKTDLLAVKHLLNKFSTSSKLVSGNLQYCENVDSNLLVRNLDGIVDVYMWNSDFTIKDFVPVQNPIWLETPKTEQFGFHSALLWAKRLGDTAKNSYNSVLFWSGQFSAVFDNTPMFWVSYLYKKLIANGVLEIRSNTLVQEDAEITAYCAKEGAMIVTATNTDTNKFSASIKLTEIYFKKIKVQKYVVTSRNDGFTYLNEIKLSKKMLKINFAEPDVETIETDGTFHLTVPANSLTMIVLHDVTVPACDVNPNEETNLSSEITYPKTRKNEIVGNIKTLDDFRRFLIDNKIRTPKRTTKLEIVFAERPLIHNHMPNQTRQIELQLTNDEIKKILLDRAKASIVETNDKQLEMDMKKAVKKLVKNTNVEHQKLKWLSKDRIRRDTLKKITKSRDLIARMAPVTMHEKKGDDSFEEEILKSGEKYLDEGVRILTESDTSNYEMEKYSDNYFFENFGNVRIKRENAQADGKLPSEDVLGNIRKWQNRFNRSKKINSDIVSSKRNKKTDMKLLKEKMENRKKMGDWIKKRHARPKRSLLNRNDVYVPKVRDIKSINPYVPKVLKEKWKADDLRLIKKKPSYSIENLNHREFLPTLKRNQRRPRNTAENFDLDDNTIDEEIRNKIPKISSVSIQSSTISTYESVSTNNTSNYVPEEEVNGENFFNSIVSNLKYFIDNIYDKVSSYFTT